MGDLHKDYPVAGYRICNTRQRVLIKENKSDGGGTGRRLYYLDKNYYHIA